MTVLLSWLPRWLSDKELPAVQETRVRSLGWEDPLEEEMETHSSILAWRIPWIEEPGGLQSVRKQRGGHGCQPHTAAQLPQLAWAAGAEPLWLLGCHIHFSQSWWPRGPRSRPWRQILYLLRFTDSAFLRPLQQEQGAPGPFLRALFPCGLRQLLRSMGCRPAWSPRGASRPSAGRKASLPTGCLVGSVPTLSSQ